MSDFRVSSHCSDHLRGDDVCVRAVLKLDIEIFVGSHRPKIATLSKSSSHRQWWQILVPGTVRCFNYFGNIFNAFNGKSKYIKQGLQVFVVALPDRAW